MRALTPCLGLLVLSVISCSGDNAAANASTAPPAASVVPDLDAIALSLVQSVRVKEGDRVLIAGSPRDLELLEDLNVAVAKAGGFPRLLIVTERMQRRYYDEVPEKYDGRLDPWSKLDSENADVVIAVDGIETPDLLANVDPQRTNANAEANTSIGLTFLRRGVRTVFVGNGFYPTHATAARYGMTRDELARIFWEGVAADASALRARGQQLAALLQPGAEVHVTHPSGTDIKLKIGDTAPYVSAGALTEADEKEGGARAATYLPAGEAYVLVAPGSAEGRIVADRYPFQGEEIEGLDIRVSKGKIVSMTAKSGLEPQQRSYDAAGAGKDVLSLIDFGLNPAIQASPGSRVLSWIPSGMVTLSFGNDSWAGGTNTVQFGMNPFLPGATVTIGGRVVIENGVLKL